MLWTFDIIWKQDKSTSCSYYENIIKASITSHNVFTWKALIELCNASFFAIDIGFRNVMIRTVIVFVRMLPLGSFDSKKSRNSNKTLIKSNSSTLKCTQKNNGSVLRRALDFSGKTFVIFQEWCIENERTKRPGSRLAPAASLGRFIFLLKTSPILVRLWRHLRTKSTGWTLSKSQLLNWIRIFWDTL